MAGLSLQVEVKHSDIIGDWLISRNIEDKLNQRNFILNGKAIFIKKDSLFYYKETGIIKSDDFESRAHQDYTWIIKQYGWKINFSDGSHFHDLELENTKQEVYHHCGNDIYKGEFTLNLPKEYEVIWNVSGPNKNYISHTSYNREIRK